ncbi:hypothetical protein T552_04066 [Pneumocystis carinii B80]|uniref:Uncharacterized protein n=1 Tax=Pneumocystis carinii (strain B80) TaxID=1408658 RepID=A0A0W4ZQL9_PNEC8|nr:hypothetical protein T552_04066 [Pneumocystis carinii B80]KTW30668.1 hypothetical protein T552_04066 [Pneumocystis carinii B80]
MQHLVVIASESFKFNKTLRCYKALLFSLLDLKKQIKDHIQTNEKYVAYFINISILNISIKMKNMDLKQIRYLNITKEEGKLSIKLQ